MARLPDRNRRANESTCLKLRHLSSARRARRDYDTLSIGRAPSGMDVLPVFDHLPRSCGKTDVGRSFAPREKHGTNSSARRGRENCLMNCPNCRHKIPEDFYCTVCGYVPFVDSKHCRKGGYFRNQTRRCANLRGSMKYNRYINIINDCTRLRTRCRAPRVARPVLTNLLLEGDR